MQSPMISVITPSRNSGQFLEDALLSVALQDGVKVEHVIQDSLSNDDTLNILRRYPEVRWQWESDCGQSDAINRGFLRARGELVGWLNADDYYLPGGLKAMAEAAEQHPEADVFYGDCVFVDGEGSITRSKVEHEFDPDILLYFGCYIPSTATFFRRRVIERGHLLDSDFRVCMDFEYFVRLAGAGFKFHYVPQFIAAFRWHDSNISLQQVERRAYERLEVQRRHGSRVQSQRQLELLRQGFRVKRILLKITSGNAVREMRIRLQRGANTMWMRAAEAQATCASLTSL
ncbi:MAG TPA: glycosyltransferase family 2 protein [Candidatus Eisenbacteria bacterium]|nr:glycosyltransferase family 2 protein [Candidatus Eisenbacteria bacterium]